MSDQQSVTPEQFSDMVDRFINLANELGNTLPRARVNAAFLFAAARYNAFNKQKREERAMDLGLKGKVAVVTDLVEARTLVAAQPDVSAVTRDGDLLSAWFASGERVNHRFCR